MSTLDRLETILIDADFQAPWPIKTNSALELTSDLALAWGDEPRAIWPAEIQALYPEGSGRQPLTIEEFIQKALKKQAEYEDLVGLPDIDCQETADPSDSPDVQIAETTNPKNNNGFSLPDWTPFVPVKKLKRALFNEREAVSVLEENRPLTAEERADPQIWAMRPFGDGLKVLRDLFCLKFHFSTPPGDRDAKSEWKNNLKVITQVSRSGLLHEVGQKLKKLQRR